MASPVAICVILAALLAGPAAAELEASVLSGANTLCLGPDLAVSLSQNAADAAACEALCGKTPPCEFWSWCPSTATGCAGRHGSLGLPRSGGLNLACLAPAAARRCDMRTFGSALPGGTCLLSHDAKKSAGARMVTIVSGSAVNWTCGYLAPGGSSGPPQNPTGGTGSGATTGAVFVKQGRGGEREGGQACFCWAGVPAWSSLRSPGGVAAPAPSVPPKQ